MRLWSTLFMVVVACTNRDAAKLCDKTTATCTCPNDSSFCADCSGHPQFVSKCDAPQGGVCCSVDADGTCECRTTAVCNSGESTMANCGFSPGGGFDPGGGAAGGDPEPGGDALPGDPFGGDASGCASIGFCRRDLDSCTCGASCVRVATGYICGFLCGSDTDCIGRTEPGTGVQYTRCSARVVTQEVTYDSYCVP